MLTTDRPDLNGEDLSKAIWDDETGETWAEALARFDTFGPRLTAEQALDLSDSDHVEVWAFGYGDETEDFTTVTLGELREALAEERGAAHTLAAALTVLDTIWGPFAAADGAMGPTVDDPGNPEVTAAIEDAAAINDDLPTPADPAAIIAATLDAATLDSQGGDTWETVARAILSALDRAGVEVLAPQDLEYGTCPQSDTGHHYIATNLCGGCLEYDPE